MQMISSHTQSLAGHRHRSSSSSWIWTSLNVEVKSFMAGMLVVGLLVVLLQNFRSKQLIHAVTYLDSRDHNKEDASLLTNSRIASGMSSRSDMNDSDVPAIQNTIFSEETADVVSRNVLGAQDRVIEESVKNDHQNQRMVTTQRSWSVRAYGQALALFVHMGSYRGGPDSFAVIGLGAKPSHMYGDAGFECEWVPTAAGTNYQKTIHRRSGSSVNADSIKGKTVKYLPDWNMGRQYTVVVLNCSFEKPVGIDREGGKLVVYALYGNGSGRVDLSPERFVAFREKKGEYDAEKFRQPYPYDFVYCGSPLYGNLNAQRLREWMAYHAKLFGKRAHFFLYDAGGISASVERVLQPWRKGGFVSVQDIRQEERYDGYYHNQFLVVNDCLHRARFLSPWTFFFDVDEYVYVPSHTTLWSVMQGFSNYTQVIFRQKPMAAHLCAASHHLHPSRMWGFEKLVYRNVKAGIMWDRKYAIQARRAFTAGVHRSDHIERGNIARESLGYFPESAVPNIWYYHFHNTIDYNEELCTVLVEPLPTTHKITSNSSSEPASFVDTDGTPYCLDTSLQTLAGSVKSFERQCIGHFNPT